MLERTERLRPETSDRSTHLSELTPNSAKIAYVQAATSDSCMNNAASFGPTQFVVFATVPVSVPLHTVLARRAHNLQRLTAE